MPNRRLKRTLPTGDTASKRMDTFCSKSPYFDIIPHEQFFLYKQDAQRRRVTELESVFPGITELGFTPYRTVEPTLQERLWVAEQRVRERLTGQEIPPSSSTIYSIVHGKKAVVDFSYALHEPNGPNKETAERALADILLSSTDVNIVKMAANALLSATEYKIPEAVEQLTRLFGRPPNFNYLRKTQTVLNSFTAIATNSGITVGGIAIAATCLSTGSITLGVALFGAQLTAYTLGKIFNKLCIAISRKQLQPGLHAFKNEVEQTLASLNPHEQ